MCGGLGTGCGKGRRGSKGQGEVVAKGQGARGGGARLQPVAEAEAVARVRGLARDGGELRGRVVVEVERRGEAADEARVGGHQVRHGVAVAGEHDAQRVAVVLHLGEQSAQRLADGRVRGGVSGARGARDMSSA